MFYQEIAKCIESYLKAGYIAFPVSTVFFCVSIYFSLNWNHLKWHGIFCAISLHATLLLRIKCHLTQTSKAMRQTQIWKTNEKSFSPSLVAMNNWLNKKTSKFRLSNSDFHISNEKWFVLKIAQQNVRAFEYSFVLCLFIVRVCIRNSRNSTLLDKIFSIQKSKAELR